MKFSSDIRSDIFSNYFKNEKDKKKLDAYLELVLLVLLKQKKKDDVIVYIFK